MLPSFMGHNKPTSWILSLRFFDPLSKLTYGLYIVHPVFIIFNAFNTPGGEYVTMNKVIVNYITWVVVGFTVSYMLSMVVETPWANLEGIFLFKRPSRVKKDDKPNEEPLKHLEDKIDIAQKDWENQNSHALHLAEENKDELSSESSFENDRQISSRTPLLK